MVAKEETIERMFNQGYIPMDAVVVWKGNYNRGDIGGIYTSITQFGFNKAIRIWKPLEEDTYICMAGNHSLLALRWINRDYKLAKEDDERAALLPKGKGCLVVDGDWYIQFNDISHLTYKKATAFAIADNAWARKAETDDVMLLEYLQDIEQLADELGTPELLDATGFDRDELALLAALVAGDNEEDESAKSDGSLLDLANVTIDEPKTDVLVGDIFRLSGKHILIICDVFKDWKLFLPYLKEGVLFLPYAGAFVTLTKKALDYNFVIVQPDPYIASHILDKHKEIYGDESVVNINED